MISPIKCDIERTEPRTGRLTASLAAMISFLRGLPLFVSGRPRTPLRVLCLMAFDTVHVLRNSRRLSSHTLQTLASLLDFGACVNDFFDGNDFSRQEYRATRQALDRARMRTHPDARLWAKMTPEKKCVLEPIEGFTTTSRVAVEEYMSRLRDLENQRPSPGGDVRQHRKVQAYRESVIRLSLGMIAATALDSLTIEDGIRATHCDEDLETLYRIVMLCQIIDDVFDLATDTAGGLPSFLTAHASPPKALALTSDAAIRYADRGGSPSSPHVFPFRVALLGVSVLAKLAIKFAHWRLRWHARRRWSELTVDRRASTDARS